MPAKNHWLGIWTNDIFIRWCQLPVAPPSSRWPVQVGLMPQRDCVRNITYTSTAQPDTYPNHLLRIFPRKAKKEIVGFGGWFWDAPSDKVWPVWCLRCATCFYVKCFTYTHTQAQQVSFLVCATCNTMCLDSVIQHHWSFPPFVGFACDKPNAKNHPIYQPCLGVNFVSSQSWGTPEKKHQLGMVYI